MSKTIEEIGLIVGGLALAAIPGLQALGIIAIMGHATLLSAMLGVGLSATLSGVGLALRQTPTPVGTSNSINFSNGVAPRRVIYGQFQTAGVLTYASFPPGQNLATTNEYLHLVYTLAGHEITSFDAVIVSGMIYNFGSDISYVSGAGEERWHIDPGPSVLNDFYWQHMMFEFDFGRDSNVQPFPNLAGADSAWTADSIQQGCAKVHVVLRADIGWPDVFPGGQIPNIQFLVTGKRLVDPRIVTAWLPSTGYAKYQWFADGNGVLWIQQNSPGTSSVIGSRPNFEGISVFPATLTDNTLSWTSIGQVGPAPSSGNDSLPQGHLVKGRLINDGWAPSTFYPVDYIVEAPLGYLQAQTVFAGGTGSVEPAFSTTLGGTVSDGTAAWVCLGRSTHAINSSNPALVVNDYLLDTDYGMGAPAAAIDTASVIAAANVCEEQLLIIWNPDGHVVFEDRYACNGMFDHSSVRGNVLTALCGSMAGWVVPPGDLWHVFAGAFVTPTITLTDADLRGPIKGDFRLSKRDVANGVKGTFIPAFLPAGPAAALSMNRAPGTWQSQSFPAYQANGLVGKPDYIDTEDGGQVIWQDIQLDFTTSLWMAQRLAKITLMRLRFQQTLTLPCKLTAFAIEAGDVFGFTHLRWGMLAANFEATQVSLNFDDHGSGASGKDQVPIVGVDLVGRQVDASIYQFTPPSSPSNYGEYSPYGVTGVMTGVE